MLLAVHYRVMENLGSLESTQEARVALGYRLGQLLTDINVLSCGPKASRFRESRTPFPLRDICKNPRSIYARVPQAMAQFVLKIEKLSHIMGPTPILEMARAAYGLRPRLLFLISPKTDRSQAYHNRHKTASCFSFSSCTVSLPCTIDFNIRTTQ